MYLCNQEFNMRIKYWETYNGVSQKFYPHVSRQEHTHTFKHCMLCNLHLFFSKYRVLSVTHEKVGRCSGLVDDQSFSLRFLFFKLNHVHTFDCHSLHKSSICNPPETNVFYWTVCNRLNQLHVPFTPPHDLIQQSLSNGEQNTKGKTRETNDD